MTARIIPLDTEVAWYEHAQAATVLETMAKAALIDGDYRGAAVLWAEARVQRKLRDAKLLAGLRMSVRESA